MACLARTFSVAAEGGAGSFLHAIKRVLEQFLVTGKGVFAEYVSNFPGVRAGDSPQKTGLREYVEGVESDGGGAEYPSIIAEGARFNLQPPKLPGHHLAAEFVGDIGEELRVVLRQPAGEDEHLRIEQVNNRRATSRQVVCVFPERDSRQAVARIGGPDHFFRRCKSAPGGITHQRGRIRVRLEAACLAARAGWPRSIQLDVAKAVSEEVRSTVQAAIGVAASSHARAERDANKRTGMARAAENLLGHRQGIGVILDRDRHVYRPLKLFLEVRARPARKILRSIDDHTAIWVDPTCGCNSQGCGSGASFATGTQALCRDLLEVIEQRSSAAFGGRWQRCAQSEFPATVNDSEFCVRGPKIDSDRAQGRIQEPCLGFQRAREALRDTFADA